MCDIYFKFVSGDAQTEHVFEFHCAKLKEVIFNVMSVLKQMTLKNHSSQKEPVSQKDSRVLNSNETQSRDCIRN